MRFGRFQVRAMDFLLKKKSSRERILHFEGKIKDDAHSNAKSLQMDENKFLESTIKIDDYLNHSCDPNCIIDFKKLDLIALRDIKPDEEITFNYLTTEWDLVNSKTPSYFKCNCSSENCYKEVKGFRYLSLKEKLRLRKFLSPFLKRKLKEELSQK